jgi:hypothetical protein
MREAANLDDKNEKHIVTPGRSLPANCWVTSARRNRAAI